MAELALHFEFAKDTDLNEAKAVISERLSKLPGVEAADAVVKEPRLTGLEIAAGIAATVAIVRGTRELIVEIRALIPQIKGLINDLKGLKSVEVEVGDKSIPIDQLTDDQLEQLAREQAGDDESD